MNWQENRALLRQCEGLSEFPMAGLSDGEAIGAGHFDKVIEVEALLAASGGLEVSAFVLVGSQGEDARLNDFEEFRWERFVEVACLAELEEAGEGAGSEGEENDAESGTKFHGTSGEWGMVPRERR